METLSQRFGRLLASHRRQAGLTRPQLAEKSQISVDMIAKLELGVVGARFRTVEALAGALEIDPSALFSSQLGADGRRRPSLQQLMDRLESLDDSQLRWLAGVVEASLTSQT